MSTRPRENPDPRLVGGATMAFVKAFDAWMRRSSVARTGESVPRLQLLYELHCNGPRKMANLADTLGVTPRSITALVDGLESEDLVRRTPHPTDRRVTMVEITGGESTVEAQFEAFEKALAGLFADVPADDRQVLLRALSEVQRKIEAEGEPSA